MSRSGRLRADLKKETELLKEQRLGLEAQAEREKKKSNRILIRGIRSRRGGSSGFESSGPLGGKSDSGDSYGG